MNCSMMQSVPVTRGLEPPKNLVSSLKYHFITKSITESQQKIKMANKKKSVATKLTQLTEAVKQMRVGPSKKRPRRRSRPSAVTTEGTIMFARKELLRTVKLDKSQSETKTSVDLVANSFSFLKGLAAQFDRIKFHSLKVFYKPAVGTTYGGLVAYGADWDFKTDVQPREKISSLTPNACHAAWNDSENRPLVLPPSKLQSRAWYTTSGAGVDAGPCRLLIAANGKADSSGETILGEIWVQYKITMMGTNPA